MRGGQGGRIRARRRVGREGRPRRGRHLARGGHRRRGRGPAPARDRRAHPGDGRAHARGAAPGRRSPGRRGGLDARPRGPADPREARHRDGAPGNQGLRRGRAPGPGRVRGGADDPLRHRRRDRGRPLSRPAGALCRVRGRGGSRRPAGARRQQRRHLPRAGGALRHGPLRDRGLRDGPVRPGSGRARAGARPRAHVVCGRRQALRARGQRRLRTPLEGDRAGVGGHRAHRLRRRLAPRTRPTTATC